MQTTQIFWNTQTGGELRSTYDQFSVKWVLCMDKIPFVDAPGGRFLITRLLSMLV